jgi:hypothetical protein
METRMEAGIDQKAKFGLEGSLRDNSFLKMDSGFRRNDDDNAA